MPDGQRGRRRVVLNDYKSKKRDEGAIDIETDGGVFSIDPPELWPDGAQKAAQSGDNEALGVLLLGGRGEYDQFVTAGGTAMILLGIVQDELGLTAGESAASSSS